MIYRTLVALIVSLIFIFGCGVNPDREIALPSSSPASDSVTPPGSLTVVTVASSEVVLSWMDTTNNEAGFVVDRSRDNLQFERISVLPPDSTIFVDRGVYANKTYYYRVMALDLKDSVSLPSNVVTALPPDVGG